VELPRFGARLRAGEWVEGAETKKRRPTGGRRSPAAAAYDWFVRNSSERLCPPKKTALNLALWGAAPTGQSAVTLAPTIGPVEDTLAVAYAFDNIALRYCPRDQAAVPLVPLAIPGHTLRAGASPLFFFSWSTASSIGSPSCTAPGEIGPRQ